MDRTPQPVAVLSFKFWKTHFLASPDVLGKTLQLDWKNYLIVGVAGPRFTWYSADVYLPLKLTQDPGLLHLVDLRLKPGVTPGTADAALQPVLDQFAAETRGVTMTAISTNATPPQNGWPARFEVLGKPALEQQIALINLVNPGYFAALRIPLLEGRIWSETENHNGLISLSSIGRWRSCIFPNGDAIGHSIKFPTLEDRPPAIMASPNIANSWLVIVGTGQPRPYIQGGAAFRFQPRG
jgi:hypothetical protein